VHWDASDRTQPPGPVEPPPADLWRPPPGSTPASGNFAYVESEPGDFVGGGATFTLTPPAYSFSVVSSGNLVQVDILDASTEFWLADFQGMSSIPELQPGYYGNLRRFPFHNPARGGLEWFGDGRGCNDLTGWFVVDAVTYSGSTLTAIDVRFEQHCDGMVPALHGELRWTAGP
jgi:hypothetical protein